MFCIVESFRYGFYFLKMRNLDETFIGKLFGIIRYNSFLVCYPLGAGSECLIVYLTARMLSKTNPDFYSIRMPNRLNFAFDMVYFMYALIPIYGTVFPQIYTYLLRQRKAYMLSLKEKRNEKRKNE